MHLLVCLFFVAFLFFFVLFGCQEKFMYMSFCFHVLIIIDNGFYTFKVHLSIPGDISELIDLYADATRTVTATSVYISILIYIKRHKPIV